MEMETPDCLRCRHLLSAAMDGEATFNETEYVRKHLAGCPDCREAQQAYNSLRAQLRLLPTPEPPVALRMAVLSRMNGKKAVYARPRSAIGFYPLLAPWQKGVFVAAVLALVFVAGFIFSMVMRGQPFEVAAQPVADIQDQKVVIVFTRPVDRNYIMANAPTLFSIKDAQNNPLQIDTANIVIDGNRVELPIKRDSGQLQENEQIQVVVAPEIKDERGAEVANPGPKVAVVATQDPGVASGGRKPTQVVAAALTSASPTQPATAALTNTSPPQTTAQASQPTGNPTSTTAPPGATAAPSTGAATPTSGTTVAPTTAPPATTGTASPGTTVSPTVAVTTTAAATVSPTAPVTGTTPVATSSPSPSPSVQGTSTSTVSPSSPSPSVPPSSTATASPTVPATTAPPTTRPTVPATLPPTETGTPVVSGTTVVPSTVPDTITPSTTVSTSTAGPSTSASACKPVDLGPGFDNLYPDAQARLGCPTSPAAKTGFTYQVFQKGSMLYSPQTGRIYVFYNFGGWASYRAAGAVAVPPTSTPAASVSPGSVTPDPTGCSLKPRGSFGTLWSNNQAVQNSLGCPVAADDSTSGGLSQNFSRGLMLFNPLAALPYLVVYSDGGFQAFLG